MATNALRLQASSELALGSLVNPYVISAAAFGVVAAFTVRSGISFAQLLVVAAFLAGWSSAWSP
jgi:hypothetical protein